MPDAGDIILRPIGVIHTNNPQPEGTPIQPVFSEGQGQAEVFVEYRNGLKDLEDFSHIILVYLFHHSKDYSLRVVPFMDEQERGLFSTRAPRRPNPIGISVVELMSVEDGTVVFKNPDMVDGTPLLDIKPYVPDFDSVDTDQIGWLEGRIGSRPKADSRFVEEE